MAETETPFTRTCAWTGQEHAGKHYVLKSTEGEELVHEGAFRGTDPATVAALEERVAKLERQLQGAKRAASAEAAPARRPGRPRKSAATVPAQASAKE